MVANSSHAALNMGNHGTETVLHRKQHNPWGLPDALRDEKGRYNNENITQMFCNTRIWTNVQRDYKRVLTTTTSKVYARNISLV